MAKSIKLQNETYIDSTGIVHKKEKLSDILNRNKFSTEEAETNKIWIDGKSIYRKGYGITMPSTATVTTISLNISNLNTITSIYGIINNPTNKNSRPLPFADSTSTNAIRLDISQGTNLNVTTYASWNGYSGYVFVEYTKTN